MQRKYFTRRIFTLFLLILLTYNSLEAATKDSISFKNNFSIGLNFNSLIHLPFLSVDFGLTPRLGLMVEAKPLVFPFTVSEGYRSSFIISQKVWENYNLKGIRSSLVLHWIKPNAIKKHFTPAIELTYSYQHRNNFYIKKTTGRSRYKTTGIHSETKYYEVFSRSKIAVNFLINYGKEKFKIFLGVGLAGNIEYGRGYIHKQSFHILGNSSSYSPFISTDIYFSPVFRIGARFSILSFTNNIHLFE